MTRRMIPVQESITAWWKDPTFQGAYTAQEGEFALADALIRGRAKPEQAEPGSAR